MATKKRLGTIELKEGQRGRLEQIIAHQRAKVEAIRGNVIEKKRGLEERGNRQINVGEDLAREMNLAILELHLATTLLKEGRLEFSRVIDENGKLTEKIWAAATYMDLRRALNRQDDPDDMMSMVIDPNENEEDDKES